MALKFNSYTFLCYTDFSYYLENFSHYFILENLSHYFINTLTRFGTHYLVSFNDIESRGEDIL